MLLHPQLVSILNCFRFTVRTASEDKEYENIQIPKGLSVSASTCQLHNDPNVFQEPMKFRPDRFLPENRTVDMLFAHQVVNLFRYRHIYIYTYLGINLLNLSV